MEKILLMLAGSQVVAENYESVLESKFAEDPIMKQKIKQMGEISAEIMEEWWKTLKTDDEERAFSGIVNIVEGLATQEHA